MAALGELVSMILFVFVVLFACGGKFHDAVIAKISGECVAEEKAVK